MNSLHLRMFFTHFYFADKCDQSYDCTDKSDELNCVCNENEFQCQCYKNNPVDCKSYSASFGTRFTGCIPIEQQNDGIQQCSDGSDENYQVQKIVNCGQCDVTINRLNNVSQCHLNPLIFCDNPTCYNALSLFCSTSDCNTTDFICVSNCMDNSTKHCNRAFQCDDGRLGLTFQLCDGIFDCLDKSDEIQHQHGFKCVGVGSSRKCILPQRNLHDNVAQCSDESDLCKNNSCFQCFDRRLLISSKQVCDGIFDCYDWSDECLCEDNLNSDLCKQRFPSCGLFYADYESEHNFNSSSVLDYKSIISVHADITKSTKTCQTRMEDRRLATLCDGRPECSDLSDECYCKNPPEFCNDTCHINHNIGDRYCDGIEDDFYIISNKLSCFKGFEELNCPKRFVCKAGNKVSVDVDQICDGKQDCDDNRDEQDCGNKKNTVFSSHLEMIANSVLKSVFWIMSIVVICGNFYVIVSTTKLLASTKLNRSFKYQHLIVLNISIADMIMGIYLLVIAVYSIYYSGYYGQIDLKWRSSLRCSIIGSLAVLSSEASCFFMVLLTSFLLYRIYKPLSILSRSTGKYVLVILLGWLTSFVIAVLPISHLTSEYFVHSVEFSNQFTSSKVWSKENITTFACRLAEMNNQSIKNNSKNWEFTKSFLMTNYPGYSPGVEFGYYGQTSVCMPRFYVYRGENAWEYSLAIITINFLSFIFIAIGYVCIFMKSRNKLKTVKNQTEKTDSRLQRRILRIIVTDFLCWFPICIIAFVKLGGIYVDDVAYIVTAGLLLPINSAFNPFLYSSLPDKLIGIFKKHKSSRETQQEVIDLKTLTEFTN